MYNLISTLLFTTINTNKNILSYGSISNRIFSTFISVTDYLKTKLKI